MTPSEGRPAAPGDGAAPAADLRDAFETATDPERIWDILDAGNRSVVQRAEEIRERAELLERLAEGQRPRAAVLACADSRIAPELFFRRGPGDLFVVRTAGFVAGPSAVGSLEFAVSVLRVPLVVVVGHELCGAVKTALDDAHPGSPALAAIVARIRPACEEVPADLPYEQRWSLAARANVRRAWRDALEQSEILRTAVASGGLGVVHAIHDVRSGRITRL